MAKEKDNVKTVFNTTLCDIKNNINIKNRTCSDNITKIKYILDKNWQVS